MCTSDWKENPKDQDSTMSLKILGILRAAAGQSTFLEVKGKYWALYFPSHKKRPIT
jgi:hypothetical protein